MGNQVFDVGTQQGFTPRHHHHAATAEGSNPVNDVLDFSCGEFVGPAFGAGSGIQIAVFTAQVTAPRKIEGDQIGRVSGCHVSTAVRALFRHWTHVLAHFENNLLRQFQ